ncbi:AMP-binding protein [Umezawaea beigongshangensis]|uniref:AMP-binding protein n=1 Tax=Umezawaea beigongshangensis TaxID=2780383 RepID=UPI0018F1487B|nr:AMP-binding protein [Umezawaea beigongshangensis]
MLRDTDPTGEPETLCAAFDRLAQQHPGASLSFPATDEHLTAPELAERSAVWARALVAAGVEPGEVVGLLVPTGPSLPLALGAVPRAGAALSVMPTPRRFVDPAGQAKKLAGAARAARMRHVIADAGYAHVLDLLRELEPGITVVDPAELDRDSPATPLPDVAPDDLAVVQFTSGSTGTPKGVMLPHRTMLAGLRAIALGADIPPTACLVQWVPHFHDMGLFGWLAIFLGGGDIHMFRSADFISDPVRVLRHFAAVRGTILTGPNFSYDIIANAVTPELAAELDLSSWRQAFNGAEPVNVETVRAFTERLSPAGVGPSVMYPVYGMAEATLGITFPEPGSLPRVAHVQRELLADGVVRRVSEPGVATKAVVSVGKPLPGIELRVVDEHGTVCGDDRLGEIQVAGPSVTTGYLHAPAATAAAFDGRWLRTGDLGFTLDGELFVTGRTTDMIIVRGQNFFPEDVELVVRDLPGVYRRRCVAFADRTEEGAECVAVAVEALANRVDSGALASTIRSSVTAELGISPVRVHVLEPRSLPSTTSGKWQRGLTRSLIAGADA